MVWTVKRIEESDFGCEERLPGEPLLVLVTIECEDGRVCCFEVADNWLRIQEIDEGDEWPEDIGLLEKREAKAVKMAEWMDNYLEAIAEMEDDLSGVSDR